MENLVHVLTGFIEKRALILICCIFLIKTLVLGMFITPLWDVPDEHGHYAYVQDIAHGRGIPRLGEAVISKELLSTINPEKYTEDEPNWIAQHPPLYYLVAALFLKGAELVTDDPYLLLRAPRVLSALSGSLALAAFFFVFLEVSGSRRFALASVLCISFIPMFSHMSSGTSHDTFLTLLVSIAVFFFIRLIKYQKYTDALFMACFLSLAGVTKVLSPLAIIAPMLFVTFFYLSDGLSKRLWRFFTVGAVAGFLPGIFLIHNWITFGNPLATAGSLHHHEPVASISIIQYILTSRAIETTYIFFLGMLGFVGTGKGDLLLLRISGFNLLLMCTIICTGIALSTAWYYRYAYRLTSKFPRLVMGLSLCTILLLFLTLSSQNYVLRLTLSLMGGLLVFVLLPADSLLSRKNRIGAEESIVFISLTIVLFFATAYIFQLRHAYEMMGHVGGTQGRYWFPMIPFLMIAYIYPGYRFSKPRSWILMAIVSLLALNELSFYVNKALPFYYSG